MSGEPEVLRPRSRLKSSYLSLNRLVKKVHMYLGLLNLTILFIFGLTGLIFLVRGRIGPQPRSTVHFRDLQIPASLTGDKEISEYLAKQLRVPMAFFYISDDRDNHRAFALGGPKGETVVTVLPKENRIRVEVVDRGFGNFVDNLHAWTNTRVSDWRVRLWCFYVEFSIWSLIAMALNGTYLWLCSRPGYVWAHLAFWAGSGTFVLLYILSR